MDLNEGTPSEQIRCEFEAEPGNVIVGFNVAIKDNKVLATVSQARVVQNYIIDDDGDNAVKTTTSDLTDIFFGSETFPSLRISNNERDTPAYGKNTDRRFNDDHLITKIDIFSEYEGSTIFFNYDTFASKYDAVNGELSPQCEQATDANSTAVSTKVRGIADEFYKNATSESIPKGVPETQLTDSALSPLRGFYMFVQGDDLETHPLVFITDTFIDKQIVLDQEG